jgi:hypothetical protein
MGWVSARTERRCAGRELVAGPDPPRWEATVNAHGVVVAMPLGQSWAPTPSIGCVVNVGTVRYRPSFAQPARKGAGSLPAVRAGRGGGPVVVAGVTTRHGGRESRPSAILGETTADRFRRRLRPRCAAPADPARRSWRKPLTPARYPEGAPHPCKPSAEPPQPIASRRQSISCPSALVLIRAPISTFAVDDPFPGLKSEVALESALQRNRFPGQRPNPGAVGSQGARQHRRDRTARPAARRQTPGRTGRTAGAGGMVRLGCRARGVRLPRRPVHRRA